MKSRDDTGGLIFSQLVCPHYLAVCVSLLSPLLLCYGTLDLGKERKQSSVLFTSLSFECSPKDVDPLKFVLIQEWG